MIAVDTSILIAIIRNEAEADACNRAIAYAEARLVSAVSMLEAAIVLAGSDRDRNAFEELHQIVSVTPFTVVPFDHRQALIAREAFPTPRQRASSSMA